MTLENEILKIKLYNKYIHFIFFTSSLDEYNFLLIKLEKLMKLFCYIFIPLSVKLFL